jgi:hypothetical protein
VSRDFGFFVFCHESVSLKKIPVANLPPVLTTLTKLVAKFSAGVVDTGGAPLLANISANFRKNTKRS